MLNFNNFYELTTDYKRLYTGVGYLDKVDYYKLFSGTYIPEKVLSYFYASGSGSPDFIFTGLPGPLLVAERIINAFKEEQITGWSSYEVNINDDRLEQNYYGLSIIGKCGPQNKTLSKIFIREKKHKYDRTRKIRKGFYFDEDSWDNSDLFAPTGTMFILVVKKVKTLLEELKATNVVFTPLTEYEETIFD